jgi:hypothetical protein
MEDFNSQRLIEHESIKYLLADQDSGKRDGYIYSSLVENRHH